MALSTRELYLVWLAGFFDGEGCVQINRTREGNYRLFVQLSQNRRSILEEVQTEFGGAIYESTRAWFWHLTGVPAWDFLQEVRPYLRIKGPQVAVAEEFMATFAHTRSGVRVPGEIKLLRSRLHKQIHDLKAGEWVA